MSVERSDMVRKVLLLGARGGLFQSGQVREALGISTDDREATTAVHNGFKSLVTDGAVELVPSGGRARNRYYKIKDENKLRQFIAAGRPGLSPNVEGKVPVLPERLIRIEGAVQDLQHRMEQLESKMDQLIAVWS